MTQPEEIDRPAEPWQYPYIAGALDWGANFKTRVISENGNAVRYTIIPQIMIESTDSAVLGFLDEFCLEHGMNPRLREKEHNYRLEINRRDDVETLLRLLEPFVVSRRPEVEIVLEDLIPGLNERKHTTEEGFVKMMGHVDEIRKHTVQRSEPKYTQDYFRQQFNL